MTISFRLSKRFSGFPFRKSKYKALSSKYFFLTSADSPHKPYTVRLSEVPNVPFDPILLLVKLPTALSRPSKSTVKHLLFLYASLPRAMDGVMSSVWSDCRNALWKRGLLRWPNKKHPSISGGCFFLACEDFCENVRPLIPPSPPPPSIFFVLFCFEVEISSRSIIPLFMPGSVHI